jgi:uncharacterized membrane protein
MLREVFTGTLAENDSSPQDNKDSFPITLSPHRQSLVTWLLIAIFVVVLGGTIYVTTTAPPAERFTEFYLLGPGGMAAAYPTNLTLGDSGTVIVGITNRESEDVTYLVHVWLNDTKIGELAPLTLGHDATSERAFTFTPTQIGSRWKLEFFLYRADRSATYRDLHLWITVTPP